MIQFSVLASGSRGNSTYVKTGDFSFLIDCGTSCKKVEENLDKLGVDPDSIDGILVSHEHIDHVKSIHTFCRKHNAQLYSTVKTYHAGQFAERKLFEFKEIVAGKEFSPFEGLEIFPCPISHDAVDPVGFIVHYNGMKLSHITDLGYPTELVAHSMKNSDAVVIEFNHDPHMLKIGDYPWSLKQRILSRSGHLSNSHGAELLEKINTENLKHVVLAHLSEDNNNRDIALMTALKKLEKEGHTHVEVASQHEPTPLFEIELKGHLV